MIERVSVNNSAFYSITILLVIALFAHRFKESMGRSLVFAAILLGIAYTFHYVVKLLNLGLYNLNDLFGTSFFSSETIRWKDQIAPMVLIGILVALIFCAWSEKFKVESAPVRYGIRQILSGFELAARNSLSIVVACATAGILIGVITTSGLSTKFTRIVVGFHLT